MPSPQSIQPRVATPGLLSSRHIPHFSGASPDDNEHDEDDEDDDDDNAEDVVEDRDERRREGTGGGTAVMSIAL